MISDINQVVYPIHFSSNMHFTVFVLLICQLGRVDKCDAVI